MRNMFSYFDEFAKSGYVDRWHTERGMDAQTVADHTWGVMAILWLMYDGGPSPRLINLALFHDMGEHVTGDIPAPTKWANPQLKKIVDDIETSFLIGTIDSPVASYVDKEERIALKVADTLECMAQCYYQRRTGNLDADQVLYRLIVFLEEFDRNPLGKDMNKRIDNFITALIASYEGMGAHIG